MASQTSSTSPVHLSGFRALVAWRCPRRNDMVYFRHPDPSSYVSCTVSLDASQGKAVVRVRVPVHLKYTTSHQPAPRQKPSVFVFISPDGIRSISPEDEVPRNVASIFSSASVGLSFSLNKKPVLVAPSNEPLVPKNQAFGQALSMIQSLAQAAGFTIYSSDKDLSRTAIDSICAIDWAAGHWFGVPSQADLSTLYRGSGGWIVSPDRLFDGIYEGDDGPSNQGSPPSYDELALPSPPRLRPGKRRREESRTREPDEDNFRDMSERLFAETRIRLSETIKQQILTDDTFHESIKRQLLEQTAAAFHDDMQRQIDDRAQHGLEGLREEMKCILANGLQTLEDRVKERLERLDERIENVQESVDDALDQVSDLVDVRMDDQLFALKEELRETITGEVKDAEDRIRTEIDGLSFTINL